MKMVLVYVTNVQVKMNMFRKGCMLFCFAKTIEFACELRKHCSFLFTPFLEDFQQTNPFLVWRSNTAAHHGSRGSSHNQGPAVACDLLLAS